MNDPFSDEEEVDETEESGEQSWLSVAIAIHSEKDEPKSLAEAVRQRKVWSGQNGSML